jgi:hypothetical protein
MHCIVNFCNPVSLFVVTVVMVVVVLLSLSDNGKFENGSRSFKSVAESRPTKELKLGFICYEIYFITTASNDRLCRIQ